ncbi:putative HAD superfamily Cof-like phosphohydrolase [Thermocatellispora tengchongensis]|uniref:Putative HAD superfamily Cof-like phosphohydrolase n=1 Tax=Thermocatellispora tengchongensis TaxID=1073253 RepID=A0A840PKC3_9ACTN|nr:MazG nucleotide pyrophosphohydrolase domain-containing protein [Thermocatellispora tengchongensis]MBB5139552.1 putative HAD superfamily Cof-like phosphohydrolase [Thermocatellispora tengchongensis]
MTDSIARSVREFHDKLGLGVADSPALLPPEQAELRRRLLHEEVRELDEAVESGDLVAIAHELADVVYVAYGTAVTYGIDLDRVLAEIHRANMTKSPPSGGKARKGPGFVPPDVAGALYAPGQGPVT